MTWKEFKEAVEAKGVNDDDQILAIDIDGVGSSIEEIDVERDTDGVVIRDY